MYAKKIRGAPRRKGGCTQFDKEPWRAWDEFETVAQPERQSQRAAGREQLAANHFFFRARARTRARTRTSYRYAAPGQASACTVRVAFPSVGARTCARKH